MTELATATEYSGLHNLAFRAMGCDFDMWVANENERDACGVLSAVKRFIDVAEQSMSRFRANSELSSLNANSGQLTEVSSTLCEAIGHAVDAAIKSDGIYDPTVLSALMAAGYDRSFELIGESDDKPARAVLISSLGMYRDIEINQSASTVRIPVGVQIDLGGIGKAWASHKAAELLAETGPCIVSAGGDVAIVGESYPGEGWLVAVRDPFNQSSSIATLDLRSCGVATSGVDHRNWTKDGKAQHHLIDPRTGRPAETDLASVTVVAPDLLIAERIALSAMIVGSRQGLELIEHEPGAEGLAVRATGEAIASSGFDALRTTGGDQRE